MPKLTFSIKYSIYLAVFIAVFSFLFLLPTAQAASKRKPRIFPLGCRPQGFRFEMDALQLMPDFTGKKQQQTLYFFLNTTDHPVNMMMRKPRGQKFGPDYKNTVQPHSWAVFALDFKHFEFICSNQHYSHNSYYGGDKCSDFFKVCEYNNAKFAPHNMGTYWTVKSAERRDAVRGAIKNGILLRS
ncbi:MAG: enhanced entry protein [Gammaproteobacteria bacterium]|nr:enhanced entry protein [Gammaproteobacteria bacterium]MCH9743310.1 enhanced entry protein [Gammaproteobacteria bacterium]